MLSFTSPYANASLAVAKPRPVHPRQFAILTRKPTEILPRLWLSGLYPAVNEEHLAALGVTHIVSVIEQRPKYPRTPKKLKTLHIPVYDFENADILQHLETTTAFIKSALDDQRNTVLVSPLIHSTHPRTHSPATRPRAAKNQSLIHRSRDDTDDPPPLL